MKGAVLISSLYVINLNLIFDKNVKFFPGRKIIDSGRVDIFKDSVYNAAPTYVKKAGDAAFAYRVWSKYTKIQIQGLESAGSF